MKTSGGRRARVIALGLIAATFTVGMLAGCSAVVVPGSPTASQPSTSSQQGTTFVGGGAEERARILEHWPDAVIPDSILTHPVQSTAEWQTAMIDCVRAAGFPAEANEDGIAYPLPPADAGPDSEIAKYVCTMTYPIEAGTGQDT